MLQKSTTTLLMVLMILLYVHVQPLLSQTKAELAKAILSCEDDLDSCRLVLLKNRNAYDSLYYLYERRILLSDSVAGTLRAQLKVQDSITYLLKANSDTLQTMVNDYTGKLNELDKLYSKTLQQQSRPWLFTGKGFEGLLYGILIGGLATAIVIVTND